jgi:hypothetical protein
VVRSAVHSIQDEVCLATLSSVFLFVEAHHNSVEALFHNLDSTEDALGSSIDHTPHSNNQVCLSHSRLFFVLLPLCAQGGSSVDFGILSRHGSSSFFLHAHRCLVSLEAAVLESLRRTLPSLDDCTLSILGGSHLGDVHCL